MQLGKKSTSALTDNPINWIVVVKRNKGKAPLLPSVAVSHDINDLYFAKLLEIIPQVWLLCVFFDASNKDLFHSNVGSWSVWVLESKTFVIVITMHLLNATTIAPHPVVTHLPGNSSFRFYHSSIDLMGTGWHGSINFLNWWICYKAKTPGSLAVGVPHDLKEKCFWISSYIE